MKSLNKPSLRFACEKNKTNLQPCGTNFFCDSCSKKVIDFTRKTDSYINKAVRSSDESVCGIFKPSQLNKKFVKYAIASMVAASSITTQSCTKDEILPAETSPINPSEEEITLTGIVYLIEDEPSMPEPVGGHAKLYEMLKANLRYPKGVDFVGIVFLKVTVDPDGLIKDVKVMKGNCAAANEEAVKTLNSLDLSFNPALQNGKPVESSIIIPIRFSDH
ncbi:MAG: energy transducer TonB [Imperialibacter sp.]|uniref:energy transducer TonB n=1 Tax=Imperialibacter sp. TaxID=2038411 RepID=UPI0032ECC146